jgi:predicted Zn-dependent protease
MKRSSSQARPHFRLLAMKALIAVLFGASLWAQEVNNAFTLERERVLGKQIAADIRQQSTPFGNPVVDAYLQRVGNTLTSRIPDEAHAYTFEAVITRQVRVDPIPLPGGHILIPINFLLSVQDEAEFTCMLGHSIAHIALRHGFLSRRGPGSTPLVFVASHTDPQQLLIPKGLWGTQRNNELDADKFGLELAARSGYDPSACRRYVERTQPATSSDRPLPTRKSRLEKMDELLNSLPVTSFPSSDEFLQVQAAVRSGMARAEKTRPPTLRRPESR